MDAWNALASAFEDKGVNRRCVLLGKLFDIKLKNCNSMEGYVTQVLTAAQDIAATGKPLDDDLIATLLLRGLTPEYKAMRLALENTGVELTSDYIKMKLLQEEYNPNLRNAATSDNAFVSHFKPKKKQEGYKQSSNNTSSQQQKIKGACFVCNKKGHRAAECFKNPNRGNFKKSESEDRSMFAALTANMGNQKWYVDSGATTHMTCNKDWLINYKRSMETKTITCANNEKLRSEGTGKVEVMLQGRSGVTTIDNVTYVPNLSGNLLSVNKLANKGFTTIFSSEGCNMYLTNDDVIKGNPVASAVEESGLYRLNCTEVGQVQNAMLTSVESRQNLWHRRLGHLGIKNMELLKDMVDGLDFTKENHVKPCLSCFKGKQTRLPFVSTGKSRAKDILELVHSDVCGPMPVESWGGSRYFVMFIDDKSRKTFVYLIKHKSEVKDKFREFKALVEKQTGKSIKAIRTDNGLEYVCNDLQCFFKENGIRHQLTVEYNPEMNGVSERANRTIVEKARSMLQDAGLSSKYWGEAVNTAVYLKNRCPTKAVNGMVPEESWTGRRVSLDHLKVFGAKAFVHIPHQKRTKWDSKSQEMIMVGYCEDSKAYRLIDPEKPQKVKKERNVKFLEDCESVSRKIEQKSAEESPELMVAPLTEPSDQEILEKHVQLLTESEDEVEEIKASDGETTDEYQPADDSSSEIMSGDVDRTNEPVQHKRRYPTRERKQKRDDDMLYSFSALNSTDPKTIDEAYCRRDKEQWEKAMREEMVALNTNKTWDLVDRPNDKNVVKNKWVFKLKVGNDGPTKYKARLVARGFSQKPGEDFYDTFAPVVKSTMMRVLFGLAAELDLDIHHVDITTAFLNAALREEIYMEQPEGFVQRGYEDKVCKLRKAIYGLKQAARSWNQNIHDFLEKIGFEKSKYDACVYLKRNKGRLVIIGLHVDDFYIFSNDKQETQRTKDEIGKRFKMKDLGTLKECLGIKVTRNMRKSVVELNEAKYVKELLKRFNMEDCMPVGTPLEVNNKLEKEKGQLGKNPYQELTGALMYLAIWTRPDISHAVSYLSQFNTCHNDQHWSAAKRVLRYLKGTIEYGLLFRKGATTLVGYADADWAACVVDRHSYTGYILTFAGGPICWLSRKQSTVALSVTEAEYVAICEAGKETVYVKGLLGELYKPIETVSLYNDNQGAGKLVDNPIHHSRTKHIDVKYHHIRELSENEVIKVRYCPTERMPAGMMTKGLPKPKHVFCMKHVGLM
jgi:transposase InsO family protein